MCESLFIKTLAFAIVFSVCPPKWKAKMRMVVSVPVEERVLMTEKSTSVQNGLELSWPHSSAALSRPPLKCLLSRAARWVDQNILSMKTFARQCSASGSKWWHSSKDFRQFYFSYAMLQPDAKLKGKKQLLSHESTLFSSSWLRCFYTLNLNVICKNTHLCYSWKSISEWSHFVAKERLQKYSSALKVLKPSQRRTFPSTERKETKDPILA